MRTKSRKNIFYKNADFEKRHKLVVHFIVFAIFAIFIGKSFFVQSDFFVLYIYGISVTAVLFINFYYAIFRYEDPAIIAKEVEENNYKKGVMPKRPLVSCMVAVFNEEDAIEQCILSLTKQTYENKEIIFVNDGSTDGTAEVLDEYAKSGKIKVIHQKNAGKKRALGAAMREARGSVFAFSDSDSVWAMDAIEKIVPIFNVFPEVGGGKWTFQIKKF